MINEFAKEAGIIVTDELISFFNSAYRLSIYILYSKYNLYATDLENTRL